MARLAERSAAGLIVLVAAYLRLAGLEFAQWRNDEEIIWLHALRAIAAGRFPWVGIPSDLGLDNGPAQMLPVLPAALLQSPFVAYVLVASLNVLAVAALYRLGRLWGGAPLGLAAAAICAVSTWAVIHSRRLWGNDMVAPFAVLLVTALWELAVQRRRWRLVAAAGWLALVLQMYVAAVVHLAVLAVGFALAIAGYGRRMLARLRLPALLAMGLFALLTAGYGVGAFLPHVTDLTRAVRDTRAETPAPVGLPNWAGFPVLVQSTGTDGYRYYLGHAALQADVTQGLGAMGSGLAAALFVCGLLALLWQLVEAALRRPAGAFGRLSAAALLLTWVLAMPGALVAHDAPVCACFLLPSYPAQYLVVAIGALAVGRVAAWGVRAVLGTSPPDPLARVERGGQEARFLSCLLLAAVVLAQLVAAVPFFRSIGDYWPSDRYGLPYDWHVRIVEAVAQSWRPGMPIVVSGHGELDGVLRDEIDTRLPAARPRIVDDQQWLTVPGADQPPMLVLLTPGGSPAHDALSELAVRDPSTVRARVTVPGAGELFRVLEIWPADANRLNTLLAPPAERHDLNVAFAGDTRLDLLALPARLLPGRPTPVRLEWTIRRTNPFIPADSYYVHFVDAKGTTAMLDAPFLPPGLWQQGERVWSFGRITDPGTDPAPRDVLIGLYVLRGKSARDGVIPIPATDAAGHVVDAVRLGPAVVRAPDLGPAPLSAMAPQLVPGLDLLSADVSRMATAGAPLIITLRWQATLDYPARYTVFIHLLDSSGALRAQQDGEPDGGAFPTSSWLRGELVTDRHTITLPSTLPAENYTLEIGVYLTGHPDQPHMLTWPQPLRVVRP